MNKGIRAFDSSEWPGRSNAPYSSGLHNSSWQISRSRNPVPYRNLVPAGSSPCSSSPLTSRASLAPKEHPPHIWKNPQYIAGTKAVPKRATGQVGLSWVTERNINANSSTPASMVKTSIVQESRSPDRGRVNQSSQADPSLDTSSESYPEKARSACLGSSMTFSGIDETMRPSSSTQSLWE